MKLLIDTGATRCFIDPEIVKRYFPTYEKSDPFLVSTSLGSSTFDTSITIPAFEEFNVNTNIKFFVYKFHNIFDGLIGMEVINALKAKIDFSEMKFCTSTAQIDIHYLQTNPQILFQKLLPGDTATQTKVPVNVLNGNILIPRQQIRTCIIPEIVTTSINGWAMVEIHNASPTDVNLTITHPIKVMTFDNNFEIFNFEISSYTGNNQTDSRSKITDLIRIDHMNVEEKKEIMSLCKKYADIFHVDENCLPFTTKIKHRIRTVDEIPVHQKTYRYPFIHKEEVQVQIKKMLQQEIIRPSSSPWSSPIWVVPKKMDASGKKKWRIVIDYRKLNEKTIDDRYPIPNITDVLDKLGRCNYFSTLDLASGFHQIQMHPDDIEKTAFNVENGHYEFLRMPFGLKNSPATFQRIMDHVLRGLQNEICLVYLDDIIVYSTSLQEHIVNLKRVFQRLREANFKIQLDKSEFLRKETAYLGHIITPNGIKPNPDKIKCIQSFPIPTTPKQIKSFLGLLGYYRRFIPDFAKKTKPMTLCLKKGAKINHTAEFVNCFETCKGLLTNEPILQYPDFSQTFNLTTDASQYAIGAVLSQGCPGKDKPVAFASRTLNDAQQNYSTIERELLAIVWAVKYFLPYLFGRKFHIFSDHKPLAWLFSIKDPNTRLLRWRLKLDEYNYQIIYNKGTLNSKADALSRIKINEINMNTLEEQNEQSNHEVSSVINDDGSVIGNISEDPDPNEIDLNDEQEYSIHTSAEDPIFQIPISETPINYFQNQIILQVRLHTLNPPKILRLFQNKIRTTIEVSEENFEKDIIDIFKEFVITNNKKIAVYIDKPESIATFCTTLQNTFKNSTFKLVLCNQIVEDIKLEGQREQIVKSFHESITNHRGITEIESQIKRKYYWPNIRNTVTKLINNCELCQVMKYDRNPPNQKLSLTPTPRVPFEIVHADTFSIKKTKFLTIVDKFSKYAQAYPLDGLTSIHVTKGLIRFMTHHGIPKILVLDNGSELKNTVIEEFSALHRIKIHYTTPLNPNSNSIVERFHSTILEHIRILTETRKDSNILDLMPYAILGYNHSIHSATKQKPIDIINGHLDSSDPFNVDVNKTLYSNYINDHKQRTIEIYKKLNRYMTEQKEAKINKLNENRHDPLPYKPSTTAYHQMRPRNKANPRFKPLEVTSDQRIAIETPENLYHKSNLRKPLNNQNYLQDTFGPSSSAVSEGDQNN